MVLYETVLPRAFAALRKLLREQAKAKAAEKETTTAGGVVPNAPQPVPNADSSGDGCRSTDEAVAQRSCAQGTVRSADDESNAGYQPPSEADRLWEEARGMVHSRVPDFTSDWRYMSLLHKAAKLGHAAALSKIGDYAYRRGAFVEAFYWKWKAETNGWKCGNPSLDEIRMMCVAKKALSMPGGLSAGYGPEEDGFARAVLAILSGQDKENARAHLMALAERGVEEARLFLSAR